MNVGGQYGNEEEEKERCLSNSWTVFSELDLSFESFLCLACFCVSLSVCLFVCVFMCQFFFVSV